MYPDASIYQKAFHRYLRTGVSMEVQLAIADRKARRSLQQAAMGLAKIMISTRIETLRQKFAGHDRPFPDHALPDTFILEWEFAQRYIAMRMALLTKGAPPGEQRAAEAFLQDWFAQKIDPVIQPLYGVASFLWVGNSAHPCANCASHEGQIYRWDEGIAPPGCSHCRCTAEPVFEPTGDDAPQPSAQELLSMSWRLNPKKGDIRWMNQLKAGNWTKAKITDTIRNGERYSQTNRTIQPNRPATRYQLGNDYIVMDAITNEVIQVSRSLKSGGFLPNDF